MTVVFNIFFSGTNLPQYAHEDRQSYLIDYFQNMCNELSSNYEDAANADASVDFGVKIVKFLDETLGSHRSRIYNPGVVRLLHIIKQYIEKPHIQYIELPLVDFIRLIEGPQWEECAEKLKTTFSSNIFVSLKNEVIDAGRIGLYIEGPSVYELSSIKTHLTTYIDKTVNPPKDEQKKETGDEKSKTSGEKEADVENCEKKTATDKSDENITDVKEDVERSQATDSEKSEKTAISSTSDAESVSKEDTESSGNEKKRNSRSVDRYLQADEPVNKDVRDAFMRSKSVPATMEIHESHTQKPKRAKYDSECSNENISRPNPMQELTLFKESLSLVLAKRLEDNTNSMVHV